MSFAVSYENSNNISTRGGGGGTSQRNIYSPDTKKFVDLKINNIFKKNYNSER